MFINGLVSAQLVMKYHYSSIFYREFFWDAYRSKVLLPPASEVWGKVIFSQACVSHSVHGGEGGLCMMSRCLKKFQQKMK